MLTVERREGCAWVTLDRPPLNLLTPALVATLRDALVELRRDSAVRAAVITGAGRLFSGGMQLEELRDLTPVQAKALITLLHETINQVHEAPFPTICMINGHCLGASLELALA